MQHKIENEIEFSPVYPPAPSSGSAVPTSANNSFRIAAGENLWFGFLFYACCKLQQIAYTTRWRWVNILENTQNENVRCQAQFPVFLSFLSDSPWKGFCAVYIALSLATFTCEGAHKDSTAKREREGGNPLQRRVEAELSTQRTQAALPHASCLMWNTVWG